MFRRVVVLMLAFGLLVAACSSDSGGSTPDDTAGDDGTTPSVTITPGGTIDGPVAPDFTLALGADGSETFTLSEGAQPVYMVFWAEW